MKPKTEPKTFNSQSKLGLTDQPRPRRLLRRHVRFLGTGRLRRCHFEFQRLALFSSRKDYFGHCPGDTSNRANLAEQFLQRAGIRRLHFQDKTFIASHVVTLQHVTIVHHLCGKLIDIALITDRNTDKSGDILTDLLAID